jgi:hypothetical protein
MGAKGARTVSSFGMKGWLSKAKGKVNTGSSDSSSMQNSKQM